MPSQFLVIGHRGAAGLAPEHTRPSFERAMAIGVDMIELDVQLTRDRQLVVIHDRDLGRTVPGTGSVREYSLAELQQLDCGSWFSDAFRGEAVLSLVEVFDLLAGRLPLNVEIKSPEADWSATARELATVLKLTGQLQSTVISSFEIGALREVRRALPEARLGVLWQLPELEPAWEHAKHLDATSFHPFVALISRTVVKAAHDRGLRVHAWTVNDEPEIQRVVSCGVDGIISDFPDRLRRARDRMSASVRFD